MCDLCEENIGEDAGCVIYNLANISDRLKEINNSLEELIDILKKTAVKDK